MNTSVFPQFRWVVAFTYVMVIVSSAVVLIAPAPMMGEIARSIGVDLGTAAGVTMGTFNLFVAISAIVGGTMVDRFGVVRIWFASLTLLLVGTALVPVVGSTGSGMTAIRLIQGCGTGPIMGCVSTIAATWFPREERGILTGLQGLAMGAGVSVGLILTPMLAQTAGSWQAAMAWETALIVLAMMLAAVVALGPKPPVAHSVDASDMLGIDPDELKKSLASGSLWSCVAGVFLLSWIFQAVNDLTPSFLAIKPPVGLGMGPLGAGQMFTIVQIAFMVGAISSSFISERFFGGRTRSVVVLGFLVTAVTSVLLQFARVTSNSLLLTLDLVLLGFFMAQVNPQIYAFIAKNFPERLTGKIGGLVTGIGIFGGTAGVAAGATALHMTGMYVHSINIVMVVAILGIFSAFPLEKMKIFNAAVDASE